MTDEIPRIDAAEFRKLGLLQEVNRRCLHPMGLALEIVVAEDGSEHFGGVWDYRDDPEGIYFAEVESGPIEYTDALLFAHLSRRRRLFGGPVQPVGKFQPPALIEAGDEE